MLSSLPYYYQGLEILVGNAVISAAIVVPTIGMYRHVETSPLLLYTVNRACEAQARAVTLSKTRGLCYWTLCQRIP